MGCVLPFRRSRDVARRFESRPYRTGRVTAGEPPGVVEMQVRREHEVDAGVRTPGVRERVIEMARAIDGVDPDTLCVHLVADPGVDDHRPLATAHEQRTETERDAVPFVGRRPLLPERLGNDAEHRSPVQPEVAVEKRRELQISDDCGRGLHGTCFNSTSTPCVLAG